MKVRIKRLSDNAVMPAKAHVADAGFDLVAMRMERDNDGNMVYHTDIALEIPEKYVGFIFPRSSIARKDMTLTNCVGVIDSCYRGEITFKFKPLPEFNYEEVEFFEEDCLACAWGGYSENAPDESIMTCSIYKVGDRIGQLIIMPIPDIEFEESDELSETDRGTGGYGSSGR